MSQVKEFSDYREKMNARILEMDNTVIKRIFNLDTNAYQAGELDKITKELIGLACSMVLRCDDCVRYHIMEGKKAGITDAQFGEAFAIANLIGGTIVIPHLRRAVSFLDELNEA